MQPGQTLTDITVKSLSGLTPLIDRTRPDAVLVQGDTTTTFAAALAAFYHKVPVGHVEAGLRTGDVYSPYPEEVNRRLTTRLTRWHFPPTATSAGHLLAENVPSADVTITGNTVVDALLHVRDLPYQFPQDSPVAEAIIQGKRIVLVTAHRRESWGEPMANIFTAVRRIAEDFPDVHVFVATHRNPIVSETAHRILDGVDRRRPARTARVPAVREAHGRLDAHPLGLGRHPGGGTDARQAGARASRGHRAARGDRGRSRRARRDQHRAHRRARDAPAHRPRRLRCDGASRANPFGDGTASRQIVDVLAREL